MEHHLVHYAGFIMCLKIAVVTSNVIEYFIERPWNKMMNITSRFINSNVIKERVIR